MSHLPVSFYGSPCRLRFAVLSRLVTLFLCASYALAQSTASLEGTITDTSGAVVPNAKITIHNVATGEERNGVSDSAGLYVLPFLPVGTYRVNVVAPGMQSVVAKNVLLEVGQVVGPRHLP